MTADSSLRRGSRGGHHFIPRAVYGKYNFSNDAKSVFDAARTGPLNAETHGWSKAHEVYNDAVGQELGGYLKKNDIQPETMTRQQAQEFVDNIKRSADPRIRELNMRIYRKEIMYWMRRIPRSEI